MELIQSKSIPQLSAAVLSMSAETYAISHQSTISEFDSKYDEFVRQLKMELDDEKPFPVAIGNVEEEELVLKNIKVLFKSTFLICG